MNIIHYKLAKLDDQIDKLQKQLNTEADYVELNTPDFDPGIDDIPEQNSHIVEISVRDILTSPNSVNTDATYQAENSAGRDQHDPSSILP